MSDYEDLVTLQTKAIQLLKEQQWFQAQQVLLKIKMISPKDDELLIKIGRVCEKLNNFIGAKWYYKQSLQIKINSKTYLKLALLCDHKLNKPSDAEQYYLKVLHIDGSNDFAYFNLAKLYMKQTRYNESRLSFESCLIIDSSKAAVHFHFATLLEIMGDTFNANQHFLKAATIKPTVANYQFFYAKSLMKLKHYDEAKSLLLKAIKLSHGTEAKFIYKYGELLQQIDIDNDPENALYQYLQMREKQMFVNKDPIKHRIKGRINKLYYDDNDDSFSVKDMIQKKAKLLINGYISYSHLNIDSSIIIPSEIQHICFEYFIANYPYNVYIDNLSHFNEFGKTEIVNMLFDVLCPVDDAKIMFTVTKILDLTGKALEEKYREYVKCNDVYWECSSCSFVNVMVNNQCKICLSINDNVQSNHTELPGYKLAACYLSLLLSFMQITPIYDKLSQIEGAYIDKLVLYPTKFSRRKKMNQFTIKFLMRLFDDNYIFYQRYCLLIENGLIIKKKMIYKLSQKTISLSLKEIRIIVAPLLFDNVCYTNPYQNILSLANIIINEEDFKYWISLNWLKLELQQYNKNNINKKMKLLLNRVIYKIWMRLENKNRLKVKQIDIDILKVFINKDINLKPFEISWNSFYDIITKEFVKHSDLNVNLLHYCLKQMDQDDVYYDNWTHCTHLLYSRWM